jgi:hypothetical protein
MSTGVPVQLTAHVDLGPDADPEDRDDAVRQLRSTLLELDATEVQRLRGGPAPDGARAADGPLLDALLVTASAGTIPALLAAIAAWVRRRGGRTVKLRIGQDAIELSGISEELQREVLEAFIERQLPPP